MSENEDQPKEPTLESTLTNLQVAIENAVEVCGIALEEIRELKNNPHPSVLKSGQDDLPWPGELIDEHEAGIMNFGRIMGKP